MWRATRAAVDVVAAGRREADDDGDGLALVEIRLRVGGRRKPADRTSAQAADRLKRMLIKATSPQVAPAYRRVCGGKPRALRPGRTMGRIGAVWRADGSSGEDWRKLGDAGGNGVRRGAPGACATPAW